MACILLYCSKKDFSAFCLCFGFENPQSLQSSRCFKTFNDFIKPNSDVANFSSIHDNLQNRSVLNYRQIWERCVTALIYRTRKSHTLQMLRDGLYILLVYNNREKEYIDHNYSSDGSHL